MSVPTYAYAANNPLRYIDRDGLRISTTINVSYDQFGSFPNGPGTQVASLSASWDRGCVPDGKGGWKFDASVTAQIDVRL